MGNPFQNASAPIFNFHAGCHVTFNYNNSANAISTTSPKQTERRRLVIYSDSESSQEQPQTRYSNKTVCYTCNVLLWLRLWFEHNINRTLTLVFL